MASQSPPADPHCVAGYSLPASLAPSHSLVALGQQRQQQQRRPQQQEVHHQKQILLQEGRSSTHMPFSTLDQVHREYNRAKRQRTSNSSSSRPVACRNANLPPKTTGRCRAILGIGEPCGYEFEWSPPESELCPLHHHYMPNYFLTKLPAEIRRLIYSYLLPDQLVPSEIYPDTPLRRDKYRISISILLTCRQVYEEVVEMLYSTVPFEVHITPIAMIIAGCAVLCGEVPNINVKANASVSYDIQLMMLEQQNKRRFMIETLDRNYKSRAATQTGIPDSSLRRIRSFEVKIAPLALLAPIERKVVDTYSSCRELYAYAACNALRRFVDLLVGVRPPVKQLGVLIQLNGLGEIPDKAMQMSMLLLDVFAQQVRGVGDPVVRSVSMSAGKEWTELLSMPGEALNEKARREFEEYVGKWRRQLKSEGPAPCQERFKRMYERLEDVLLLIRTQVRDAGNYNRLLHQSRVVREAGDMVGFEKVWKRAEALWMKYAEEKMQVVRNAAGWIEEVEQLVSLSKNEDVDQWGDVVVPVYREMTNEDLIEA
ncbi:hypothetical protein FQN57_000392 [Myotisia sp. PD_48]|nr:hypothetical protein FQN57_000392 [Myotisia sp. PD_48]